jgi:hypothetical protein
MIEYPSQVYGAADQSLGALFPTCVPEPERYVWEAVIDACGVPVNDPQRPTDNFEVGTVFPLADLGLTFPIVFDQPPKAMLYPQLSRAASGKPIPVIRGWPAYPGVIPCIGVVVGSEPEDENEDGISGGFAGASVLYDDDGNLLGGCDYYSEPYSSTIVVELIHENRDERDRLHAELRRVLFPLRHQMLSRDQLLRKVHVDAERTELDGEVDKKPFLVYASVFTVTVWGEMLIAQNTTGPDGFITAINVGSTIATPNEPVGGVLFADDNNANADGPVIFPPDGSGLVFTDEVILDVYA